MFGQKLQALFKECDVEVGAIGRGAIHFPIPFQYGLWEIFDPDVRGIPNDQVESTWPVGE